MVQPRLRRNGVDVDPFGFQTRQRIHDATGVFVAVTKEHKAFQMMRRKTADSIVNRVFDIRAALVDRTSRRRACYLDLLNLFDLFENGRVSPEWNEPRMI